MDNTLYFEKISRFDRNAEPVAVSIPFSRGALRDASALVISETPDGPGYPLQTRVLAAWDDDSTKWLHVCFQPDLPGNSDKTLYIRVDPDASAPEFSQTVSGDERADGIRVDTGPLAFTVSRSGFWPFRNVTLHGEPILGDSAFTGLSMLADDKTYTSSGAMDLEIVEAGPLRVVILVKGNHRTDGQVGFELRGRITAYAGKPYVEVEHQFIHTQQREQVSLQRLDLAIRPTAAGSARVALGQGYYRTSIEESQDQVEMLLDAETMLYQSNEHFIDCFYGDFWADWRDQSAGVTVSVYQAHQNFPKKLHADQSGIICSLYPEDVEPAPVLRGMAKTHRLMLHFHGPETPLEELSTRSLQFQLPDVPSLTRAWYRENNPWVEQYFPEELPNRFLNYALRMHDGRPAALGMMHFGDAPDAGYTNQGRGRGHTVWVNNEYDRPHNCAILYGLTSQRRVLDSGLVAARHWLDVDLCHYDPDPLINGGLKIHTRYHGTGGVTPSHEWTEGLLDYYFFTGRREGLEGARSVAENIMRHMARPEKRQPGQASVREGGWALRAMIGMYLGTGEQKWRDEADRLVNMYLRWFDEYGALLAPYTSHSMPRVVFMISLTVNSFARYLLIEDDPRVKELIVKTVDDMLAHCLGPDGIPYYKELPSLRRPAPTSHFLEALTHAYRITGDDAYLQAACRCFAAVEAQATGASRTAKFVDDSGAVISGNGGGRIFSSTYPSTLLFAGAATPLGLLDWYEYPF